MKFDILEALFAQHFDCSCELTDMVDSFWDGLDHKNQNMVDRHHAAIDCEVVLEHMYDRYMG